MSEQIYKTSRAVIRVLDENQRYVYALDSQNPEKILIKELKNFFTLMGYSEIYPNFDKIRIGSIHPFSIMLAQEVLEQPKSTNMFPSVTIADSSLNEDVETLGNEYDAIVFTPENLVKLGGYRDAGEVFISESGWTKLQAHIDSNSEVIGIKKSYNTQHSLDFNIWTENKDITGFLFDMVCHFITQKRADIHNRYSIDMSRLSGRRTGDINLDFGMLLYGANVQVTATMPHESVLFDTTISSLATIDIKTLPTYFTLEGVSFGEGY